MQADGADIESITSKGYRLISPPTVPRAEYVRPYLHSDVPVFFRASVTSTNDVAKQAARGQRDSVAPCSLRQNRQPAKGRKGRTWISPKNEGVYITFLLRPAIDVSLISGLTLMAAVGVVRRDRKNGAYTHQNQMAKRHPYGWQKDSRYPHREYARYGRHRLRRVRHGHQR